MTKVGKRELADAVRKRYWRASKKQKSRILDEFVATTGYHRKYALWLLGDHSPRRTGVRRRRRQRTYTADVSQALIRIWDICDRIASRRLHPFLPEMLQVLERHDELHLAPASEQLLLTMSRSTMDRLLRPARRGQPKRGRSTTKPGTLLKRSIPIRTFADWDDAKPGFLEIDLVAHCAESTEGEYLATLDTVDVVTGWSECIVPANRGQQAVRAALLEIRERLPVPLLGIDSDNDGAFINDHLLRYCQEGRITFTRSRPYKKNDQAHVEQKNWSVVRRVVGYDRYEGAAAQAALNALYHDLRLYVNFFQPSVKLKAKTRVDGKVKKMYDEAQTPYQRIVASPFVSETVKRTLTEQYLTLNPVTLHAKIVRQLDRLWDVHALRYSDAGRTHDGKILA
ncbi:MAG: transposase family protein [Chloroflexota bacterium]|jgi:hypothetical protein